MLITHGPAFGILDHTVSGLNVGCDELKSKIDKLKPKVHICGHIYEAYGQIVTHDTLFINASMIYVRYQLMNDGFGLKL